MPFSQLTLEYDGGNSIRISNSKTNADNSGIVNGVNGIWPVIPVAANKSFFEMRVVAAGDTARIIQNDFANWRGLEVGAGFVRHRLEKDEEDPEGAITGIANLAVEVRRKAYTAENVTGTVIFDNRLETIVNEEPPTNPIITYIAAYSGQDSVDQGTAQLKIAVANHNLVVRRVQMGTVTNTNVVAATIPWEASGVTNSNYTVQIEELVWLSGEDGFRQIFVPGPTTLPANAELALSESGPGAFGFSNSSFEFRVTIRLASTSAIVYQQAFRFNCNSSY